MSSNWTGPFLHVYSPANLATRKSVLDNGRNVDELNLQSTDGKFEGGGFGSGKASSTLMNRDNHPLVEKGDIALTFCRHPLFLNGGDAICAIFIIEDENFVESADGSGTVTWTGSGISKELQRKVLRLDYICNKYPGTTPGWTDTYIYLAAVHEEAVNFYNGGIIEIAGYTAEITYYTGAAENRVYVQDWQPGNPDSGAIEDYVISHGKTTEDITQAIAFPQTDWTADRVGTPYGSFHEVAGRKCIDLVNDIVTNTGWQYATNITDEPLRMLFWFDTKAAPVDSTMYLRTIEEVGLPIFKNNIHFAPIVDCQRNTTIKSGVTRVLAVGADGLSFVGIDPGDLTIPTGFTLYEAESMLVYDTAEIGMSVHQIVENNESFDYIKKQTDTPEAKLAAQQRLLNACVDYLLGRSVINDDYTAKSITLRNASIGQSLSLKFARLTGGEESWSVDKDLWIRSFACSADASNGVRFVTYDLGEFWHKGSVDGNTALADRLKRMGGSSGGVVITGGGTAPPATGDHGLLTGLSDDDHPQYLLASGARELAGDLGVAAGKTIDGIDISDQAADYVSHKADPDAHHDHSTGGGIVDHGDLTGLGDDDHGQYLLVNGTRGLAGDMLVSSGKTIDGVDISEFKSDFNSHEIDPAAHHDHEDLGLNPLVAGPGIDIYTYFDTNAGVFKDLIKISDRIMIHEQIRIGDGAIFEMWDIASQAFRQIKIAIKNGQPFLEFAPPNDWSGYSLIPDFTMVKDGWGEVNRVSVDSTVTFTDTSSPTDGWTIIEWEWEVFLIDGYLPVFYNVNPLDLPFYVEGQWRISLRITQEDIAGNREFNNITKYLEVV